MVEKQDKICPKGAIVSEEVKDLVAVPGECVYFLHKQGDKDVLEGKMRGEVYERAAQHQALTVVEGFKNSQ